MHIKNTMMFVPQVSSTNSELAVSNANASCYSRNSYIGAHHNMNTTTMIHIRQMPPYQQQQPPQFYQSPSYHNGIYSNFKHGLRNSFNSNFTIMNHRALSSHQKLLPPPPLFDGYNEMLSKNHSNIINGSGPKPKKNLSQYQQCKQIYLKNVNEMSSLVSKKRKDENGEQSIEKSSIKNNKTILKDSQHKSKNSIISNYSGGSVNGNAVKKPAEFAKSSNFSLAKVNKEGILKEQQKVKHDTMQRNSSKASHTSSKSYICKNDTSDLGLSINGHHHSKVSSYSDSTTGKQRKSRSGNKRQDAANNTTTRTSNGQKRCDSSGFTVNNWLQNDMYCYERQFLSSCAEDNMISHHNPAHRNSTSSEAAGSDDLNSSSSNEDLCSTYIIQTKSSKKASKSRQKRQQKRKQLATSLNVVNISTTVQSMDVNEDIKENIKPNGGKQTSTTAALNLRKQCTKAAALKAVLNNSKISKSSLNGLSTSTSNSSVCSSLSSASSTASINFSTSSSASSSPTQSANSSPTASPTASKRNTEYLKKSAQSLTPSLRQFTKLNMNEQELVQQMRRYVIDPSLLRVYGFPVDSAHHEGCIEIFKCLPKHLAEEAVTKDNQRHHRHLYGRKKCDIINDSDGLYSSSCSQQWYANSSVDSGHASGESSPRFTDSDSSEVGDDDSITPIMAFYTPDGVYQIFSEYCNSVEKQCVRCSKIFKVNEEGDYLSFDTCTYHWGKLSNVYNGKCYVNNYSCCQGEELSEGCSQHALHVWNGTVVGINGPYTDFVYTKQKQSKLQKHPKLYAIDCEMSYTGLGLEVTKVTVVAYDGSLVYEHFVQTQADIIDYNTRFSGVTEKDLLTDSNKSIKTFAEVQADLLNLFDADTILIGHGLDNDLRVLRLVHKTIVDTSVIFSHSTGFPYRRSLKNLTKSFLKRDIQCSDMGHSSFEDSRACLELMMWKVRKDLRHWNYE